MQNVEFSIILPVYNAELYLKECLDSIVQQKFSSWELILIDDGSTDGSKNIYQNYADKEKMKIYMKENSAACRDFPDTEFWHIRKERSDTGWEAV